jgi:hypothetical protein
MMAAMREILVGLGVPESDILQEKFVSRPDVETPAGASISSAAEEPLPDEVPANIAFKRTGKTAELPWDETVLEAAEDAGVEIRWPRHDGRPRRADGRRPSQGIHPRLSGPRPQRR